MGNKNVFVLLLCLGTAIAFPSNIANFCDDWSLSNGVLYKSSPDAYDYRTYYTCQKDGSSYIIKEYICPFGTVWSDATLTCDEPAKANLGINDPCDSQPAGMLVTYTGECNSYIECSGSGSGEIKCCPSGELFDGSICRAPVAPQTCDTSCPNVPTTVTPLPVCADGYVTSATEGFYRQKVIQGDSTYLWIERKCPPNYTFDETTCTCSQLKTVTDGPTCDHVFLNEFDDSEFTDASDNAFYVNRYNVVKTTDTSGDDIAQFSAENPGYIQINGFSNKPWTEQVYIRLIFKENGVNNDRYLLQNADCANGGATSITIKIDSATTTVTGEASIAGVTKTVQATYTSADYKDVVLMLDGDVLTLDLFDTGIDDTQTSTIATPTGGEIDVKRAALMIAGQKCGTVDTNFVGDIEFIEIFTGCMPLP